MSLTIEQVRIYIKAVDSGRIEKRPLDGMQGLSRLAIAQDEEIQRLREALEEALPILEALKAVREVTSRMTQPSMGRHPLEDEANHAEGQLLRLTRSPARLHMLVNSARAALSAAEAPAGRDG